MVAVWGLGFKDRDVTPDQAPAIIRYFRTASVPATVLGGVPASWRNLGSDGQYADSRTEPQWAAVYRSFDVISPWTVGRFGENNGANSFARLRLVPDSRDASTRHRIHACGVSRLLTAPRRISGRTH